MSHDPEMLDILRRSIRSTGRKQLLVAALALPTGVFMVCAEALGIDPSSFRSMTDFGIVMMYVIGVTAILFSVWMLYSSFFLNAGKGQLFLDRLDRCPDQIRRITHNILQHEDVPGRLGQAHQIKVEYQQGGTWHLAVKAEHAETILNYIAQRAPHAMG